MTMFLIFKVILVASLLKLIHWKREPRLPFGIYAGLSLGLNLLSVGMRSSAAVVAETAIDVVWGGLYFWLLAKVEAPSTRGTSTTST